MGLRVRASAIVIVACGLIPGPAAASHAGSAQKCVASGPIVAGWGGSRFVPVAPEAQAGPSCGFQRPWYCCGDPASDIRLRIEALYPGAGTVAVGGIVWVHDPYDGAEKAAFYCRGLLEQPLGQDRNAAPVDCSYFVANVGGTAGSKIITVLYVPSSVLPYGYLNSVQITCSASGEVGVLVDILCEEI